MKNDHVASKSRQFENIEHDMSTFAGLMFSLARGMLVEEGCLVPMIHFFKMDGHSELVGVPNLSTEQDKDNLAKYLRDKLSSGIYGGALLLFDAVRYALLPLKKEKDALVVYAMLPGETKAYILAYEKIGDSYKFEEKVAANDLVSGRFVDLFASSKSGTVH